MSGTHGDLFMEIGKMVLAAHAGQAIDLKAKSEELARRYWRLGVPAETIAKAIARSVGAIGMSIAIVSNGHGAHAGENGHANGEANGDAIHLNGEAGAAAEAEGDVLEDDATKSPPALFPSGMRLSLLS